MNVLSFKGEYYECECTIIQGSMHSECIVINSNHIEYYI